MDLVGIGLSEVLARLSTVRARPAWGQLACSKRHMAVRLNHPSTPQLDINFGKQRPVDVSVFETLYF